MKIYVNAYLFKNLGDDLFLNILTHRYPQHMFYIISNIYKSEQNRKVLKNTFFMKVLNKLGLKSNIYINTKDISISIGGSMYIEGWPLMKKNKTFGNNPYYILGSNFGPYKTQEFYQEAYKLFEGAEDVCFRDQYSYSLFEKLPNVRCAPDIVFTLDTSKIQITNEKKVIISVIDCETKIGKQYQEKYENMIKYMIRFFTQRHYRICLMSFCKIENDEKAIKRIIESLEDNIKENVEEYDYEGEVEEALNVIGQAEIIVGTRFHANILGLLLKKTVIPIIYSDKTKDLLKDIDFKGKIIDIKKEENCILQEKDLEYKKDITEQIKEAEKQFQKLDEVLKENE